MYRKFVSGVVAMAMLLIVSADAMGQVAQLPLMRVPLGGMEEVMTSTFAWSIANGANDGWYVDWHGDMSGLSSSLSTVAAIINGGASAGCTAAPLASCDAAYYDQVEVVTLATCSAYVLSVIACTEPDTAFARVISGADAYGIFIVQPAPSDPDKECGILYSMFTVVSVTVEPFDTVSVSSGGSYLNFTSDGAGAWHVTGVLQNAFGSDVVVNEISSGGTYTASEEVCVGDTVNAGNVNGAFASRSVAGSDADGAMPGHSATVAFWVD